MVFSLGFLVSVVPVGEGDDAIVDAYDSMVGDGDAVDVALEIANQIGFALTPPGKALLEPQVEHVVQVDVTEHGRHQSPLCIVTRYAK